MIINKLNENQNTSKKTRTVDYPYAQTELITAVDKNIIVVTT